MIVEPVSAVQMLGPQLVARASGIDQPRAISFEQMLRKGVEATSEKLAEANRLVTAFAIDDSVPAHQVTFALEEARLSLELMMQVRNKLVEGYQQIMGMQV